MHRRNQLNNNPADIQYWCAFRKGDEAAYEYIFKTHYALLVNYGLKFNRDHEVVRDTVQTLMGNLWENRKNLGETNSIRNYLLASLRRMILREARRSVFHVDISTADPAFYLESSHESKLVLDQQEKLRSEILKDAIGKLPNRQKEALYLKYYGERSFEEIADIMEISTRAVYKLIYKAIDHLAAELKPHKERIGNMLFLLF
jgi:RNA polymerase sigma factor (sigma-70 family)